MSDNPYAPTPGTPGGYVQGRMFDISDAETIRKQHLNHEASIQGMGSLYLLGGFFGSLLGLAYGAMGIAAISGLQGAIPNNGPAPAPAIAGGLFVGLGVFVLAVAMAQFYAGWTMRKLDPKGKILAIIVTAIGLLGFPCGTLLSGYTLYLLLSAKGEFIYSPQYKEILAATPHIKYRSIVAWVLLAVILLIVVLLFVAAFLGSPR
jgi:hypothetical protein